MPEFPTLVDVEALLVAHLNADPAVVAALAGDRTSTEIPGDYDHRTGARWLQVFRISGASVDPDTGHIERASLQLHAYAGDFPDAFAVMAAAHRSLYAAATVEHDAGVVTGVRRSTGPSRNPDPRTSAPRYSATYAVTVHPRPGA